MSAPKRSLSFYFTTNHALLPNARSNRAVHARSLLEQERAGADSFTTVSKDDEVIRDPEFLALLAEEAKAAARRESRELEAAAVKVRAALEVAVATTDPEVTPKSPARPPPPPEVFGETTTPFLYLRLLNVVWDPEKGRYSAVCRLCGHEDEHALSSALSAWCRRFRRICKRIAM